MFFNSFINDNLAGMKPRRKQRNICLYRALIILIITKKYIDENSVGYR